MGAARVGGGGVDVDAAGVDICGVGTIVAPPATMPSGTGKFGLPSAPSPSDVQTEGLVAETYQTDPATSDQGNARIKLDPLAVTLASDSIACVHLLSLKEVAKPSKRRVPGS